MVHLKLPWPPRGKPYPPWVQRHATWARAHHEREVPIGSKQLDTNAEGTTDYTKFQRNLRPPRRKNTTTMQSLAMRSRWQRQVWEKSFWPRPCAKAHVQSRDANKRATNRDDVVVWKHHCLRFTCGSWGVPQTLLLGPVWEILTLLALAVCWEIFPTAISKKWED